MRTANTLRATALATAVLFYTTTSYALTCADLDGSYVFSTETSPVYLGFFGNDFASESINNSFGTYGNQFSSLSVRNTFGTYGSQFSIFREPSGRRVGMNLYVQHRPSDFGPAKDRFKEVWTTRYMHVQKKNLPVNICDEVKKGQIIAYSGSHPSGDHLHFGIRSVGMQDVNPLFIYAETFDGLEQNSKFANLSYTGGTNYYPSNAIIIWPIACKNIS